MKVQLSAKERIDHYINENQTELVEAIQEAVRMKSVVGTEQEMIHFMKQKYEDLGLETVTVQPDYEKIQDHEGFSSSGLSFDNRYNVIGIYHGDSDKRSLTLEGHVDVVSAEPIEFWTKDPYAAIIEGNRLYGRGSMDMKSGLLANWFALKALLDLGLKPAGTVQLHSTIEEESGGAGGALTCLDEGYVTDGFITTEPHSLNVTVSHTGVMYFRVSVYGKTAHASRTQDGVNAISKMYPIYHALQQLEETRAEEVQFELYQRGSDKQSVNLNIGTFQAGDWASNVAGKATIECRIGFIPGETREQIRDLVEKTILNAVEDDGWLRKHPPQIEWYGWTTEAWYQDPDDDYVQEFLQTAKDVLDTNDVQIIGRTGGNDARFTQYYNRPGIGFGPVGSGAHSPDEYVEIDSVLKTANVLANHILEWTAKDRKHDSN
ncbi:ArgE/DapE family deacylase [Geomicrobium sediminis]|uniref:Acetylornithine deacetylase n=1 Tax=Geomicrobium sediminis TaxID=1347788 RepID=A0ABS2PFX8_9BACL|nr:ArgE/DapE family deacylase [Geomicrobium sediminis]MBM7634152.1 acetylornithine deacetylase [Geomicrobium sediminis]